MTLTPDRARFYRFPVLLLLAAAVLATSPQPAAACKDGAQQCQTSASCCSGLCVKPGVQHGTAIFGTCCIPTTCAAQGKNCGTISDGCGHTLSCGACAAPNTCGGGGTANVCGCTPTTCSAQGANCGTIPNGCGGTLDCGTCTAPQTCGGGGASHQCGCTPITQCPAGTNCGTVPDGCGGTVSCGGACPAPDTCGGGGTANVCGCTPKACPLAPSNDCGDLDDGCGGIVSCPCNECFCCCDDDLHPGNCVPEGGSQGAGCSTDCGPNNGDSAVLCALSCAALCDSVSLNYLSSSCTLSITCPPECTEIGGSCADVTNCCPDAEACCAGTCSAQACE